MTVVVFLYASITPALGVDIYRSTQADGTVVFTDQPDAAATLVVPSVTAAETRDPDESVSESFSEERSERDREAGSQADEDQATGESSVDNTFIPLAPLADGLSASNASARADGSRDADTTGQSPQAALPRTEPVDPMAGVPIERVEIASPPPDATLIDPAGPLIIEIGTAPGSLSSSGLTSEALVNGEVIASGGSIIAIPPLNRGTHRLAVRLLGSAGEVVVESDTQALHVRRTFERPAEE